MELLFLSVGLFDRLRRRTTAESERATIDAPGSQLAPPAASAIQTPGARAATTASADPTIPRGSVVQVVGESNYQDTFERVTGGRTYDGFDETCVAELIPEPTNPYDSHAVRVTVAGATVGYLGRAEAQEFRPLVDHALAHSGRALAAARIKGGWDRGRGDTGSYGIELFIAPGGRAQPNESPRAENVQLPDPGPDEFRLRGSATVSVSGEEHYQEALQQAVGGADLTYSYPVLVDLVRVDANPHAKSAEPVLEARVGNSVVGHLTQAMSTRFDRVYRLALEHGQRLTCSGRVHQGTPGSARAIEIRLSACPHGAHETHVVDPYFQFVDNLARSRRSKTIHVVERVEPDGSIRTACGRTIEPDSAVRLASTKPWVGDVDPATRLLLPIDDRCQRCE